MKHLTLIIQVALIAILGLFFLPIPSFAAYNCDGTWTTTCIFDPVYENEDLDITYDEANFTQLIISPASGSHTGCLDDWTAYALPSGLPVTWAGYGFEVNGHYCAIFNKPGYAPQTGYIYFDAATPEGGGGGLSTGGFTAGSLIALLSATIFLWFLIPWIAGQFAGKLIDPILNNANITRILLRFRRRR